MRRINSDVFKEKLNYLNYELYNSHPVGELSEEEKDTVSWFIHHISKMVDNMPTENVISIEWIKKWANKNCMYCYDYDYPTEKTDGWFDIEKMLKDWEKENEDNR